MFILCKTWGFTLFHILEVHAWGGHSYPGGFSAKRGEKPLLAKIPQTIGSGPPLILPGGKASGVENIAMGLGVKGAGPRWGFPGMIVYSPRKP